MVTLSGKVTSAVDGSAIENATVVMDKKFSLTTEAGEYTMTGVNPGTYVITVLQRHYQKYQFSMNIPGDSILDISLVPE